MSATGQALVGFASDEDYRIAEIASVMTPALAIYPDIVAGNIEATIRQLDNDPNRWRPHVKTAKLGSIMRMLVERGVRNFKCATTLELQTICDAGAADVLVAYPMTGANARRVREIATQRTDVRISALVEQVEHIAAWAGSQVSLFIDINGGMDRTGIEQDHVAEVVQLAQAIIAAGIEFRGLHYYDGHVGNPDMAERTTMAHQGYDQLMRIADALTESGMPVAEVITSGTPAFPVTLTYQPFRTTAFVHRISPGTVVYGDCTSTGQLPDSIGYHPAAVVVATVVSHPTAHRFTCDAGHKSVSADAGVPTCSVPGHPEFRPQKPSEEHLPIDVPATEPLPAIGDYLYLVPRHVCPTVNNFDHALLIKDGRILRVEPVTARGREVPLSI